MSREAFFHYCRQCVLPAILAVLLSGMCLLGVMRWLDEQRTNRFGERLASVETQLRLEKSERNAESSATRVLVLALATEPPPSMEVIEVDVKKASSPHGLSPVITDLLRELRRRSATRARANSPAVPKNSPRPVRR